MAPFNPPHQFKKGDRVKRPHSPGRQKSQYGTYVGISRGGSCDRVLWDRTSKVQPIVRGFIEPA